MAAKLILVATPIGNLRDISQRALDVLHDADFIAAEDTRVSLKLLNHFGIKNKLTSYHEHNKIEKGKVICERILSGETCALITDAGMPAISDPGETLVALCMKQGIEVTIVPGACAPISALAISGISTGRFCFEGFLSVNKKRRMDHLDSLKNETRTIIFNASPHKLLSDLKDILNVLGNRNISLVKELTKIHEQVIKTDVESAIKMLEEKPAKGEFVLIIEGTSHEDTNVVSLESAVALASAYVEEGKSINEAAKLVAEISKLKKSDIYRSLLGLKNKS